MVYNVAYDCVWSPSLYAPGWPFLFIVLIVFMRLLVKDWSHDSEHLQTAHKQHVGILYVVL